ncbi:nicotinamide N-methyltransferase-like [Pseudophryne corroboree]|uniref:nicotinamide N-methyltransferase-like n=1 Tax=Pseudophryne corroboree TaxID=495146 RepID=UPI0030817A44
MALVLSWSCDSLPHISSANAKVYAPPPVIVTDQRLIPCRDTEDKRMEARPKLKQYHLHGMDSTDFLKCYFDEGSVFRDESVGFVMETLHNALATGHIKGETLIDISIGSFVHHLFDISEYFKEIIILKLKEPCIMELNKWVNTRTGAFNWNHASKIAIGLKGISDPDSSCEKEEKCKETINRIVKFDFSNENLTDPEVLPPADCLISAWMLEAVCQDQQDYIRNLRKMSKLLKPAGTIILIVNLDCTYYIAGNDRLHVLNIDESFVKKALTDEGFVIGCCEILDRKVKSDLVDHKQVIFLIAVKGNMQGN